MCLYKMIMGNTVKLSKDLVHFNLLDHSCQSIGACTFRSSFRGKELLMQLIELLMQLIELVMQLIDY